MAGWIEENADEHSIQKWHPAQEPPAGEGSILTVEYRYRKGSPRWIYTKRTFKFKGDTVEELIEED